MHVAGRETTICFFDFLETAKEFTYIEFTAANAARYVDSDFDLTTTKCRADIS
jgi:hypothetical protein